MDFEEGGFGREKGKNSLRLQETWYFGGYCQPRNITSRKQQNNPMQKQVRGEQEQQQQ